MKITNLCFPLARFCAVALALSSTITNAEITILASAGDASPDGNGVYSALAFKGGALVDLNENGQVAFTASLIATSGGTADDAAIIRADKSGQEIILRENDYADFLDARIEDLDFAPSINGSGDLAFRVGLVRENSVGPENDSAILRWNSEGLTNIGREGETRESLTFGQMLYGGSTALSRPVVLSDLGKVAFYNNLNGRTPFLGEGSGGDVNTIFFSGFLDGEFPVEYNVSQGVGFLNRMGQASFRADLETGSSVLLLESTAAGSASFQAVAKAGQITPDGLGTFSPLEPNFAGIRGSNPIPVNSSGEMVFEARVDGITGSHEALFAGGPGSLREIAREDTVPSGSTKRLGRFRYEEINDSGRVGFLATSRIGLDDPHLWLEREDRSGVDLMLEPGQAIGAEGWKISILRDFVINNSNQLAILALINDPFIGSRNAILFYDADSGHLRPAIIQGDDLDGSQVSNILFFPRTIQGRRALNDDGQLVFMYELENGISGIAMWEPGQPYADLKLNQLGEGSVTLDSRFELVEEDLYRVLDPEGKTFELTATPASGYGFSAWSGGLTSQDPLLEFGLEDFQTLELTATFDVLPPAITDQSLAAVEVMAGEPLLLRVEADGLNLDFQWSVPQSGGGGTRDPGASYTITDSANETTLEIASAGLADGGTYSVSVTNSSGTVQSADMVVSVVEPEPPAGNWYDSAINLGEGWRWFDWFKAFKPVGDDGWIYHETHGWLYALGEDASGLFLWDGGINRWLYTSETLYPWLYAFGPQAGWLWFFENSSSGSRVFARGGSGEILSEQQLQPNVTVLGAVNSPGPVALPDSRELTLSEAFATVRGITRLGDPRAVNIRRLSASGETRTLIVNFSRIISGDDPDFILQGGDVVYVPERIF